MAKMGEKETEKKEENPELNCVSPILKEKEGKPDKPWCKENPTPEWWGQQWGTGRGRSQGGQEICRVRKIKGERQGPTEVAETTYSWTEPAGC